MKIVVIKHVHVVDNFFMPRIFILVSTIPYSRKYWRELNLAIESKIAIAPIVVTNTVIRLVTQRPEAVAS